MPSAQTQVGACLAKRRLNPIVVRTLHPPRRLLEHGEEVLDLLRLGGIADVAFWPVRSHQRLSLRIKDHVPGDAAAGVDKCIERPEELDAEVLDVIGSYPRSACSET